MEQTVTAVLAELDAFGIKIKEECQEVFRLGNPPRELMARLKARREQLVAAAWGRAGRTRAAAAWGRLRADRQAWIGDNKRLGKYRGHEQPNT